MANNTDDVSNDTNDEEKDNAPCSRGVQQPRCNPPSQIDAGKSLELFSGKFKVAKTKVTLEEVVTALNQMKLSHGLNKAMRLNQKAKEDRACHEDKHSRME